MGSVVAIFLVPLMLPFMLFIGIFDTAFGTGTEKVVLPYDPENGIVWEYEEGDDAFVDCIKTTTKDGQQIFTFRGKMIFNEDRPNDLYQNEEFVDDIYFVDANGNVKTYYAMLDFSWDGPDDGVSLIYGGMDIYEESECAVFEYTVKAGTQVEGCYWHEYDYDAGTDRNRYVGFPEIVNMHERTYKFVLPPEDIEDGSFDMSFYYRNSSGKLYEKIAVTFEMVGKEVTVLEETHYVYNGDGTYTEVG